MIYRPKQASSPVAGADNADDAAQKAAIEEAEDDAYDREADEG